MAQQKGLTVWLTGLSAAGKTTLANAVSDELRARGYATRWLDGDQVRRTLCPDLGFTKVDRDENVRRIGFVADAFTRQGMVVLVSVISPYRAARDEVRARIGDFLEVYVRARLDVCEQRDKRGIYRRARSGELSHVSGIDDPYEAPLAPEVECCTDRETPKESLSKILDAIETRFALKTDDSDSALPGQVSSSEPRRSVRRSHSLATQTSR